MVISVIDHLCNRMCNFDLYKCQHYFILLYLFFQAIQGLGKLQDVDNADLAKVKVLNSPLTTLLSTELQIDTKLSNLQDQLEKFRCIQIDIQTTCRSMEERIEKTEMNREGHKILNRTDKRIANLEKDIIAFQSYKNRLSELTCDEIQQFMSEQEKRQTALEIKTDNIIQSLEDLKTSISRPGTFILLNQIEILITCVIHNGRGHNVIMRTPKFNKKKRKKIYSPPQRN